MAEGHWVYQICGHCGGDGYFESTAEAPGQPPVVSNEVCLYCNGDKIVLWGYMTKDDRVLPAEIPEAE
jgi:hypothetical protein